MHSPCCAAPVMAYHAASAGARGRVAAGGPRAPAGDNRGDASVSDRQRDGKRGRRAGAGPAAKTGRAAGLAAGLLAVVLGGWLGAAPAARADGDGDPAYIALGAGWYDMNKQEEEAADFRLEYRHDRKLWIFKPWAGIEATSDGAFYGLAGVLIDVHLGEHFVLTPSFGAGGYANGGGKDLGSAIEFRSQIEIAYRFADRSRLSLAFSHISNAGIGDDNPGTEILGAYYAIPIGSLFGQ